MHQTVVAIDSASETIEVRPVIVAVVVAVVAFAVAVVAAMHYVVPSIDCAAVQYVQASIVLQAMPIVVTASQPIVDQSLYHVVPIYVVLASV